MKNKFTILSIITSILLMFIFNNIVIGQKPVNTGINSAKAKIQQIQNSSSQFVPGTYSAQFGINSAKKKTPNLTKNLSGLQQLYSSTGHYTLSADGKGTNVSSSMNIRVNKPTAAATVQKAILFSTATNSTIANGCVTFAGNSITWLGSAYFPYDFNNYWADVTSIVSAEMSALPAGIWPLSINECSTSVIEGEALLVVFNDATATEKTIVIMGGAMNYAGDVFSVNLATPIDPNAPGALFDMGLGIGYSYQTGGSQQYSIVDINGSRLTSAAGGEDDGTPANGGLITVGGIGDNNANPSNPFAPPTNPLSDDELYTMLPFITNTTSNLTITTQNPSANDNIFLAYFVMSGAAVIGEGILLTQATEDGCLGNSHAVKAKVFNSLGQAVANRLVTLNITSGPNAGFSGSLNTDANGEALFNLSLIGGLGTDVLQACFTNSQSQVQCSNNISYTYLSCTPTNTVPTLSEWGLIILGFILICMGIYYIRKRSISIS
ncbi:MAG: IPTL-CTERM sorting domain-containing protein [Bacteroidetes bacterium]|nr:IPTL-CTERM sorting domain-containing protein [Bacteroidota bacterium]